MSSLTISSSLRFVTTSRPLVNIDSFVQVRLTFESALVVGDGVIVLKCQGILNNAMAGFYRCRYGCNFYSCFMLIPGHHTPMQMETRRLWPVLNLKLLMLEGMLIKL
jgi:hypothetical protein